ncbi:T6SS phospholipase effector Tle1-like catalytic domain-containing protein [Variovorax sp. GT1P44]|uniref:T6SS phospholipase effector Tle1-like catalytic domain-containing protein n=1 Tax=Variovorax sp. GT1P44 TaxID=3443742 RepID=UPI003F467DAE
MSENIVICCDGTANEFAADNTNVVKLYSTLVHDQPGQWTYYHPGIGTMEPPGALTPFRRRITRGLGLAFGAYLENDIRDAYAFLSDYFDIVGRFKATMARPCPLQFVPLMAERSGPTPLHCSFPLNYPVGPLSLAVFPRAGESPAFVRASLEEPDGMRDAIVHTGSQARGRCLPETCVDC